MANPCRAGLLIGCNQMAMNSAGRVIPHSRVGGGLSRVAISKVDVSVSPHTAAGMQPADGSNGAAGEPSGGSPADSGGPKEVILSAGG